MRQDVKGVKTEQYFKKGGLNISETVFATMATVAVREEDGAFYTRMSDTKQLLMDQLLFSHMLLSAFKQVFRSYKRQGMIEKVGKDRWHWLVDPRPYSVIGQDREAYRKEQEKE